MPPKLTHRSYKLKEPDSVEDCPSTNLREKRKQMQDDPHANRPIGEELHVNWVRKQIFLSAITTDDAETKDDNSASSPPPPARLN